MEISKKQFLHYKKLLLKKYRIEFQEFIIEGEHLVKEGLATNNVKTIITSNRNYKHATVDVLYCSEEQISNLSTTKTPQQIIGICDFVAPKPLGNNVIALDGVNDPGNLGTIIRTARSFGYKDILVEGVDVYNPKVLRSSQGSFFSMNIYNVNDLHGELSKLKNNGFKLIGTVLDHEASSYELISQNKINKDVLIFGNEANGISEKVISILDFKIYIPISFESLNVAIAAGIIMEKFKKNN